MKLNEYFARKDEVIANCRVAKAVEEMAVGEKGYVLPWGVWADDEDRAWIHNQYPVAPRRLATHTLGVARTPDGWEIDADTAEADWRFGRNARFAPSDDGPIAPIPVVRVRGVGKIEGSAIRELFGLNARLQGHRND